MKRYSILILSLVSILLIVGGCKIYNFTGGSLGAAKTLSIKQITNEASYRNPVLTQQLSEKIRDKFLRETKLQLVEDSADITIKGVITGYSTAPMNVTADRAAQSRLTITMRVECINKLDKEKNFNETISNFADYDVNKTLVEVENTLIEDINTRLVQDIFNKTVNNW
jgi:hypothetical protein